MNNATKVRMHPFYRNTIRRHMIDLRPVNRFSGESNVEEPGAFTWFLAGAVVALVITYAFT
jgi:hypothetical protein